MRRFVPTDLEEVTGWYEKRGLAAPSIDALSLTGFIEPGVVAGWLYATDSAIALCESFISNPESDPEARSAAIDVLLATIIEEAKRRGFRWLLAYSNSSSLTRHGETNHQFMPVNAGRTTALVRSL